MIKYILSRKDSYAPSVIAFDTDTEDVNYPEQVWVGNSTAYIVKEGDIIKDSEGNILEAKGDGILFTFYRDCKHSATIIYDEYLMENAIENMRKNEENRKCASCTNDDCKSC